MKEKKNLRDRKGANNREVQQLQAAIADQERELLGKRKHLAALDEQQRRLDEKVECFNNK